MGWMRMMAQASVDYHRQTVAEHADDFPGQALAYYASRGETPLIWGGSGAGSLGLTRTVSAEEYEAVNGPGGARHPETGERLVSTRRPGHGDRHIGVSAHKSVVNLPWFGCHRRLKGSVRFMAGSKRVFSVEFREKAVA